MPGGIGGGGPKIVFSQFLATGARKGCKTYRNGGKWCLGASVKVWWPGVAPFSSFALSGHSFRCARDGAYGVHRKPCPYRAKLEKGDTPRPPTFHGGPQTPFPAVPESFAAFPSPSREKSRKNDFWSTTPNPTRHLLQTDFRLIFAKFFDFQKIPASQPLSL